MSTTGDISNKDASEDVSFYFPEPPEKPLDSDCCGTGCTPCVFDIYDEEMLRWRMECDRIRNGKTLDKDIPTEDCSPILSTSEFQCFALDSITRLTGNTCVYRFNIPGNRKLGLKIGQHVIMRGKFKGKTITRQYTPISDLDCHGHFDVLIKVIVGRKYFVNENCSITLRFDWDQRSLHHKPNLAPRVLGHVYVNGKMSCYVKTWQVGNMIEWRGPYGNFSYTPNQYRHIGMLAAGTGIAPMLQVIQGILSNEQDETFIHLVYSNQSYDDILMKHTLDEMKAYWNFSVLYVVTKEGEADQSKVKYGDHVSYGRITQELVSREMPEPSRDVHVLICGTKSFDKDMINYLKAIGYTSGMYFKF